MPQSDDVEPSASCSEPKRVGLLEELLQEAVYRSRGEQAGAALFRARPAGAGTCGLGEKAAIVLDLTPRAEVVFDELFPGGLGVEALSVVRELMGAWVKRQDALDRRRNHYLKDFRLTHGFDRARYDDDQRARFEAGLERINAEALDERRAAARALLARIAG